MTDQDKPRIRPLDDKSDYSMWRTRVESAADGKGLTAAFNEKEVPAGVDSGEFAKQRLQASSIIVAALGAGCHDG